MRVRVLALLTLTLAGASARDGVLLYAGFEGTADARAAGDGHAQGEGGGPKFTPGHRGQGLLSGDGDGYVSYAVDGNLLAAEGTIELWVQPVDWAGDDHHFHAFVEAADPSWLVLYKYYDPKEYDLLLLAGATKTTFRVLNQDLKAWQPGQWHQLVATWGAAGLALYVDGKAATLAGVPVPEAFTGRFQVGDRPWHVARNSRSVIDELYVYDRPLTAGEVAWTFQHSQDRAPGEDLPLDVRVLLDARLTILPAHGELRVDVARHGGDGIQGTARLEPAAGVAPVTLTADGPRKAHAALRFTALPAGEYKVVVDVSGVGRRELPFRSPGPPVWRGNTIGVATEVPPPWTPLQTATAGGTTTLDCWGRRYELGALGLPQVITATGQPLLAGPIALDAAAGGQPARWTPRGQRVTERGPLAVRWSGEADGMLGRLAWQASAEYDGFLRYDLTLTPTPGATADRLELRVPLRAAGATLYHLLQATGGKFGTTSVGAVPAGEGTVLKSILPISWWVGDEARGLCGVCESDEAWDRVDRPDAFRLERHGETVEAVWSFADRPWKLTAPWRFSFGLQATPVRPEAPDRHRRRLVPGFDPESFAREHWPVGEGERPTLILWPTPKVLKYYGYPQPTDATTFGATMTRARELGLKVVPYSLIMGLSPQVPEWDFYQAEWGNGHGDASSDVMAYGSAVFCAGPSRDWIDFMLWSNRQALEAGGYDGLYHDYTHVLSNANPLGGFGYLRDGHRRPTYPIFAMRELYQRMYVMLKQYGAKHGRDTFMIDHMSTHWVPPILSFADGTLDGEHFRALGVKDNYLDLVSLPQLRAEYAGHNLGTTAYFLPEYEGEYAKDPRPTRHLYGLALLHDFQLWPLWLNHAEANRIEAALVRFPFDRASFLPYWSNTAVVGGGTDAVKVSAYTGGLLVVVNTTRQPQTVSLTVDWAKLGVAPPGQVADLLDPACTAGAQPLTVTVPALDARVMAVK